MLIWVSRSALEEVNVKQTLITMQMVSNTRDVLVLSFSMNLISLELAQLHSMAVDFPKTGESTFGGVGSC